MTTERLYNARRAVLVRLIAGPPWNGSQRAFAEAVRKAPTQISDMVNARRNIGQSVVLDLCAALGLPENFFDLGDAPAALGGAVAAPVVTLHPDPTIKQVVAMMEQTDDEGRTLVMGAVIAVLAQHAVTQRGKTKG